MDQGCQNSIYEINQEQLSVLIWNFQWILN